MNKLKDRIYIKQWLALKPYNNQTVTDGYYIELCNKVKQAILTNKLSFLHQIYLEKDEIDVLACFLTSYFEDLITGTNIWSSFINIHKKLYDKQLPFYDLTEYYEEEINLQDIHFLVWYYLNTIQKEKFIVPTNEFIIEISKPVLEVFETAWEYAPENKFLKTFYSISEKETDFYIARNLIDTVLFKTYLFYPDTLLDLHAKESEIFEESKNDEHLLSYLNENRDNLLHDSNTSLLGLKGQEWVAVILGENHGLSKDFLKISKKIKGYFLYKGQDDTDIFIEHIASGKKFSLTKKSFDQSKTLNEIDTIIYLGIVMWKQEWWFSGVYFQGRFNPDLILDEKNSLESRMSVNFLDHQVRDMNKILQEQFKAFKEFNNGMQIAFMHADKIVPFLKDYMEYFSNSLKLSKKEIEAAKQRARNDGYFGTEDKSHDFTEVSENGLVFFNPKSGTEVALEVNSAFPATNNPFFNIKDSVEHIMRLFYNESLSTELAMYCIDNFKSKLPFLKGVEGKMYLKNIDFLLRFWKKGNYFPKPSITFTGIED
jgi:hypothetical protein